MADVSDTATTGGGFDILFDSDKLQLDGFTSNDVGDPLFARDPELLDGVLSGWAFGDLNLISDIRTVGTVTLTVLDGVLAWSGNVATRPTTTNAGPFLNDFNDEVLLVDYNSYQVGVVPGQRQWSFFVNTVAPIRQFLYSVSDGRRRPSGSPAD